MKSVDNQFVKQTNSKYDMRYLLKKIDTYENILYDMGSWASAGIDDPNTCDELKGILKRIVDSSVEIAYKRGEIKEEDMPLYGLKK